MGGEDKKEEGQCNVFPVLASKMDPIPAHIQSKARGRLGKGERGPISRESSGRRGGSAYLVDPIAEAILAEVGGRGQRGRGPSSVRKIDPNPAPVQPFYRLDKERGPNSTAILREDRGERRPYFRDCPGLAEVGAGEDSGKGGPISMCPRLRPGGRVAKDRSVLGGRQAG